MIFVDDFLLAGYLYVVPVMLCCSCNERNAVCKRCVCACTKKPCSTCLPMKENKCVNTLLLHVDSVIDLLRCNCVPPVTGDGLLTQARTGSTKIT